MNKVRIMLDSGAYSAWTRGLKIDLDEYIAFVKQHEKLLDTYVNLDVIPGAPGRHPTPQEVEYAAQASLDNYKAMRAAGLRSIPVFHYGESFKWLERLIDAGADYICLGGTVGMRTKAKRIYLDKCFKRLTNSRGQPIVKVHGLGVSEGYFVHRYPWQSVDSTSWSIAPTYGMILAPGVVAGKFSAQIYVADGHLDKRANSRRFERLPASVQDRILRYIDEECDGLTMTDLRNNVSARILVFIRTLQKMRPAETIGAEANFFVRGAGKVRSARRDFRMIFATGISQKQNWLLTQCDANDRLLSYADLRSSKKAEALAEYVRRGAIGEMKRWPDPADRAKVDWQSMNYHDDRRRRLVARIAEVEENGSEGTAGSIDVGEAGVGI